MYWKTIASLSKLHYYCKQYAVCSNHHIYMEIRLPFKEACFHKLQSLSTEPRHFP